MTLLNCCTKLRSASARRMKHVDSPATPEQPFEGNGGVYGMRRRRREKQHVRG